MIKNGLKLTDFVTDCGVSQRKLLGKRLEIT